MRPPRFAPLLLAPALAIAMLGSSSPALADTPKDAAAETPVVETAPPEQPEEEDLVELDDPEAEAPAPTEPAPSGQPAPFPSACEPGYRYKATEKRKKDIQRGVGAEQANYNGTSRTIHSMFTSETEGEVGIAVSGKLKVKASVMVAEVEEEFGVELSLKLKAKIGNTVRAPTPARMTTFARYGVYRLKSKGYSQYIYANCTKGVKHATTTYTPRRVGWAIWER